MCVPRHSCVVSFFSKCCPIEWVVFWTCSMFVIAVLSPQGHHNHTDLLCLELQTEEIENYTDIISVSSHISILQNMKWHFNSSHFVHIKRQISFRFVGMKWNKILSHCSSGVKSCTFQSWPPDGATGSPCGWLSWNQLMCIVVLMKKGVCWENEGQVEDNGNSGGRHAKTNQSWRLYVIIWTELLLFVLTEFYNINF